MSRPAIGRFEQVSQNGARCRGSIKGKLSSRAARLSSSIVRPQITSAQLINTFFWRLHQPHEGRIFCPRRMVKRCPSKAHIMTRSAGFCPGESMQGPARRRIARCMAAGAGMEKAHGRRGKKILKMIPAIHVTASVPGRFGNAI
jgi:hypothetical protein